MWGLHTSRFLHYWGDGTVSHNLLQKAGGHARPETTEAIPLCYQLAKVQAILCRCPIIHHVHPWDQIVLHQTSTGRVILPSQHMRAASLIKHFWVCRTTRRSRHATAAFTLEEACASTGSGIRQAVLTTHAYERLQSNTAALLTSSVFPALEFSWSRLSHKKEARKSLEELQFKLLIIFFWSPEY